MATKDYFLDGLRSINEIWKWFEKELKDRAVLEYTIPVTFSISKTTYRVKYVEESDYIYCERLHGEEVKESHKYVIAKVEKFLNKLNNKNR